MTRTARAAFPRAIIKDRSESKTGLDKSLRKNGAGHHNWGSLAHEDALVSAALEDGELELRVEESGSDTTGSQTDCMFPAHSRLSNLTPYHEQLLRRKNPK